MSYTALPPIKGSVACWTCGCGAHEALAMDAMLAVGFGACHAMKGNECVYNEGQANDFWDTQMVEDLAEKDPDHDWRISFYAPLYSAIYQRQGPKHWVLVEKDQGFA